MLRTPLHLSVKSAQDYESTRRLISEGADLCRQDNDGRTPLHAHYNQAMSQILRYHMEEIDPWIQDHRGMTVMHYVSWSKLSQPHDISRHLQTSHVPFGDRSKNAAPLDLKDAQGRSLLHLAVQRGNLALTEYILSQSNVSTLMMPDFWGRTLLHYATESSRVHVLKFLLENKFDMYAKDLKGRTILHHAAMTGNVNAVQHLLALGAGAQLDIKDKDNRTPLELAVQMRAKSVVDYLYFSSAEAVRKPISSKLATEKCQDGQQNINWNIASRNRSMRYVLQSALCLFISLLILYSLYRGIHTPKR